MKVNGLFVGLITLFLLIGCDKDPEKPDTDPSGGGDVENPVENNGWEDIVQEAPILSELPAFDASAESCEYDADKGLAIVAYKDVSMEKVQSYGEQLIEKGFSIWKHQTTSNIQAKISLETIDQDSLVEQILKNNGLLSDSSLLKGRYNEFYYQLREDNVAQTGEDDLGISNSSPASNGVSASIVHLNLQEQEDSTGCNFQMRVLDTRATLTESEIPDSVILKQERDALVRLYNVIGGEQMSHLENWLTDAPVGEWTGITTDERGRVVEIIIERTSTRIESFGGLLKKFPYLVSLNLCMGDWGSGIFPEIGELSQLKQLQITYLLEPFQCEFPKEIFQLTELEYLAIYYNTGLCGLFPTDWTKLPNLKYLDLRGNELTGSVPVELASLKQLEVLEIGGNCLSGTVPDEVLAMSAWTKNNYIQQDGYGLDLPEGLEAEKGILLEILDEIREKNPNIFFNWDSESVFQWNGIEISSDGNHITNITRGQQIVLNAELFQKICGLTKLTYLDVISEDNIIPEQISQLENLEELRVGTTDVSIPAQPFPHAIFSLTHLKNLLLTISLESVLDEFDQLPELESLTLINCKMSGAFPQSVLSLPKLHTLSLYGNNLTGDIPFAALGERTWKFLNLENNRFEGIIDVSADYYKNFALYEGNFTPQQSGYGFRFTGTLEHGWLPKGTMTASQAAGDSEYSYGWKQEKLVDGDLGTGWWGNSLPARVTISFPNPVQLDSIRIHHRSANDIYWLYKACNPKKILLYGYQGEILPQDETLDEWELIGELNSVKPSGLEEGCTEEDIAYISKGECFALPADNPAYRHIKLMATEIWDPTFEQSVSIMEVDVKGSTTFK